jgi:hypothetical protein
MMLTCDNILSKGACLRVERLDQFCKWEDESCSNMLEEEKRDFEKLFMKLKTNPIPCQTIENLQIAHSLDLWEYEYDYLPDYYLMDSIKTEAEFKHLDDLLAEDESDEGKGRIL